MTCCICCLSYASEGFCFTSAVMQARGRLMYRLADVMEAHLTQLALLESLDSGKPLQQTMMKEIPLCIDNVRYFAG